MRKSGSMGSGPGCPAEARMSGHWKWLMIVLSGKEIIPGPGCPAGEPDVRPLDRRPGQKKDVKEGAKKYNLI